MANYELNVKINGVEQSVSSIGQLEQALTDTNQQLQQVDQNSQAFTQLNNQAQEVSTTFTKVSKEATGVTNNLGKIKASTDNLNQAVTAGAGLATELQEAGQNTQVLGNQINGTTQRASSLRAELRQITQELQKLEPGSQRFQELSVRAGELRDTIGDTNTVVSALAGNTTERLGTALSGVVNVGITGLQGVVGGMQLFGVESERAREIMEKLQGLLFLTQAIQGLGALPDSIAAIRAGLQSLTGARQADIAAQKTQAVTDIVETATTAANTGANAVNTAGVRAHSTAVVADALATEGATVATRGFTAALAANPIGLIVVGLTTLISTLFFFSDSTGEATEETDRYADSLNQLEENTNRYIETVRESARVQIELARLRGDEALASELTVKALQKEVDARKIQLDEIKSDLEDQLDTREDLLRKYLVKEESITNVSLATVADNTRVNLNIQDVAFQEFYKKRQEDDEAAYQKRREALLNNTAEVVRILESQLKLDPDNKELKTLLDKYSKTSGDITKLNNDITLENEREVQRRIEQAKRQREKEKQEREQAVEDYKRSLDEIKSAQEQNDLELQKLRVKSGERIIIDRQGNNERILGVNEALLVLELEAEQKAIEEKQKLREEEINTTSALTKKQKDAQIASLREQTKIELETLKTLNDERRQLALKTDTEELKRAQDKADKLRTINTILQTEIAFGDQSTTDLREELAIREEELFIRISDARVKRQLEDRNKDFSFEVEFNGKKFTNYEEYLNARDAKEQELQARREQLQIQQLQAERQLRIDNFTQVITDEFGIEETIRQQAYTKKREDIEAQYQQDLVDAAGNAQLILAAEKKKNDAIIQANKDANKQIAQIALDRAESIYKQEVSDLDKLLAEKKITEQQYTEQRKKAEEEVSEARIDYNKLANSGELSQSSALYQQKLNAEEEYQTKVLEIKDEFRAKDAEREKTTSDSIIQNKLDNWNNALQIAQQFADGLGAINDLITQSENQALTQQNEQRAASTQQQIDSSYAALEQELAQSNLTEEQKQERREALQKQNENLVKQSNAFIDSENRKFAKKQFERQKALNIVNALIAGAQSVLQGIATFGPPPSPLGIASIVAAGIITAAQVAAIASQKFDGGSSGSGTAMSASIPDTTSTATSQANNLAQISSAGGFTGFNENVTGNPQNQPGSTGFTSGGQRVYVLESDITATQDRVRVLESNSTFG